jgi:hypothetical protein
MIWEPKSYQDRYSGTVARKMHYVRGVLFSVALGIPFLFFAFNAIWIILSQWLSSWLPANWFSGNSADWIWGTGSANDARSYFGFMINVIPATLLGYAIRWGFVGSKSESK